MGSNVSNDTDDPKPETPMPKPVNEHTVLKGLQGWPTADGVNPPAANNQIELQPLNSNTIASNMYEHRKTVVVVLRTIGTEKSILKYYHKHAGDKFESFKRESDVAKELVNLKNAHLAKIENVSFKPEKPDRKHGKEILEVGLHPEQEYLIVTMQFCNQRDINKYLESIMNHKDFHNLDCHDFILCCYDQILYGLEDLWLYRFVHQDIKPDNIFLDFQEKEGFRFKLGDFGSCCYTKLRNEYPINELPRLYTEDYQPPETKCKQYYPMPAGSGSEAYESSLLFSMAHPSQIQRQPSTLQVYPIVAPDAGSIFMGVNPPVRPASTTVMINTIQVSPAEETSQSQLPKAVETTGSRDTTNQLVIPVVQITPKLDIYSFGKTMISLHDKLNELSRDKAQPWAAPSPLAKDHFKAMTEIATDYDPVACTGRLTQDRLRLTVFGVTATARGLRHLRPYIDQFESLNKHKLQPVLKFIKSVRSTIISDLHDDDLPSKTPEFQILWSLFVGLVCLHCDRILLRDLQIAQANASQLFPNSQNLFDSTQLAFADLTKNSRNRAQSYKLSASDPILSKAMKFLDENFLHSTSSTVFDTPKEQTLLEHLQVVAQRGWQCLDLKSDKYKSKLLRLYLYPVAIQTNPEDVV